MPVASTTDSEANDEGKPSVLAQCVPGYLSDLAMKTGIDPDVTIALMYALVSAMARKRWRLEFGRETVYPNGLFFVCVPPNGHYSTAIQALLKP